jgi:hypothetical protein
VGAGHEEMVEEGPGKLVSFSFLVKGLLFSELSAQSEETDLSAIKTVIELSLHLLDKQLPPVEDGSHALAPVLMARYLIGRAVWKLSGESLREL